MTRPVWLIAGREFRAYTTTASFWIALAAGPLAIGGAFLLASGAGSRPSPAPTLTLAPLAGAQGAIEARFSSGFPLSAEGRAAVVDAIRKDGRLHAPLRAGAEQPPASPNAAAASRLPLALILWVTLTGSLGMLLQAVVRERANRALESLLAAASAIDIVLGKLLGVGAVSLLVVGAWLGSTLGLSRLVAHGAAATGPLLAGMTDLSALAQASGLYLLAYAFYGLVTIAVGGLARDSADAQNLARPMFAVLLAVFFTALACAGGAGERLDWLIYVPPFTPFLLLIHPQGPVVGATAAGLLVVATLAAGALATRTLSIDARTSLGSWRGGGLFTRGR